MKSPVRVKIDLTEKRHNLLASANKFISNIDSVKFCYADVNCRLKIKWENESINGTFFYSLTEPKSHINADEWKFFVVSLNSIKNPCHYGKEIFLSWLRYLNPVSLNCFFSWIHSQVLVSMWCFKLRAIQWVN